MKNPLVTLDRSMNVFYFRVHDTIYNNLLNIWELIISNTDINDPTCDVIAIYESDHINNSFNSYHAFWRDKHWIIYWKVYQQEAGFIAEIPQGIPRMQTAWGSEILELKFQTGLLILNRTAKYAIRLIHLQS